MVHSVLEELRAALSRGTSALLQAPPGAGKTTLVPLALVAEPWLAGRRIMMLEPRRLAARAAARRMAALSGEPVGQTVGYRMRMESVVSAATRIEVVTEGVLTRMLQTDPSLEGTGLVIFDEYHERSLNADLGLALTLQARTVLREDLRVLVMSATLDYARVADLLGGAPTITSEGRSYPVEVRYLGRDVGERIESATARAVRRALGDGARGVLAFLPGAGEIRRTAEHLADRLSPDVDLVPLHGTLEQDAQDRAIAPPARGRRKIVLATSIAETSLTIEGIDAVVDSGLMRVPRFSVRSGMSRLETLRVTRSSAEQRCGRAGRLGPGICYRLWSEGENAGLLEHAKPEILDADMTPLALELAAWGATDAGMLAWLDRPPEAALTAGRELLRELGALDGAGVITPHGRRVNDLPVHPRLAHMILRGAELGHGRTACDLAALLSERDIVRGGSEPDADLRIRLDALSGHAAPGVAIDRAATRHVRAVADRLRRSLRVESRSDSVEDAGLLLAFAYPDRIGMLRAGRPGSFLLRNGRGARVPRDSTLAVAPMITVADLDDRGDEARAYLAAPLDRADVERHFADQIADETVIAWDDDTGTVRARTVSRLGALVLGERTMHDPPPEAIRAAFIDFIRAEGLAVLPWSRGSVELRERLAFLHHHDARWPDVSDAALLASLDDWIGPDLHGLRRRAELSRLDLSGALLGLLDWQQRAALDDLAPSHVTVPSGSRVRLDYADPESPVLAARLQEMFGMTESPRIMGGQVPLTVHLLSPAGRPVQVTRDLASFWRVGYFEVKKDLKGRYPKHYWPDDPLTAEATRRARR